MASDFDVMLRFDSALSKWQTKNDIPDPPKKSR